jgi:hypothetical protein
MQFVLRILANYWCINGVVIQVDWQLLVWGHSSQFIEEMGMLVHSCTVRDGLGHSFGLVDERGCVTDPTLMPQLNYGPQLNSSSTPIRHKLI